MHPRSDRYYGAQNQQINNQGNLQVDHPRTPAQQPPPLLPNNVISLPSLIDMTHVKIHPLLRYTGVPSRLEYDIVKPPHTACLLNQTSDADWQYLPAVEPPFSRMVSELVIKVPGVPSFVIVYPEDKSSGIITIWDVFRGVYKAVRGVVESKYGQDVDTVLQHPFFRNRFGPMPIGLSQLKEKGEKERRMYEIIRDYFGGGKFIWAGLYPSRTEPDAAMNDKLVDNQRDGEKADNASVGNASLSVVDPKGQGHLNPGELTFEEDVAGGMGRHLGVFSCTMLIVGRIIGTGIFSTPSSILSSVGSVGASLMLWVLGFVLSFCGLFVWLEYGTMFPRSGGEKVYLEAVFKKPKYLATVIFASNAILLGFTASGCIVFANNILISAGHAAERWVVRGIALGVIFFVTVLHGLTPKLGVLLMNALSVFKIIILLFIVITGWVVLSGKTRIHDPHANFRDAFSGSSHSSNDYATATFKVLNAYAGWSNVNYVMNDVKNPVRTLKIAGPLGLGICAVFYLLANVAYFAAATKQEIRTSGVTVASLFFKNVFGTEAQKALSAIVALSALGNVITITYAASRVNQGEDRTYPLSVYDDH
ncbi:High-affinity methionine permease [Psilocybe cubensis]|uniref:High-affinity methionine permease n=1 Tax=Psilocybe cubensis TaxID=181762 RepID=A0ACB8GRI1_PSICU|nr:High-affinity methionine permease [Psilocybe cubensis]KAH9478194.1 High-affinity methionine permease [Psilocybe cubensis]